MSMITIVDIKRATENKQDWRSFIDMIMDDFNTGMKCEPIEATNPVVRFIASILRIDTWSINDAFRYYKAFAQWPASDASSFINESMEGPEFLFSLYDLYDLNDLQESTKKMYSFVVPLLD